MLTGSDRCRARAFGQESDCLERGRGDPGLDLLGEQAIASAHNDRYVK